jgi:NAD+ dependent glucose-6-phosphate dehydrogenase
VKVAVTGSAGNIGKRLCADLQRDHQVVAIDVRDAAVIADVRDFEAVKRALEGCDAVVHLGGMSPTDTPWQAVYEVNIGGTYNVYEAARQAGCNRIIFASSNHAMGWYEVEAAKPALYRGKSGVLVRTDDPVRPDTYYGVSKVFGEALGRYYSDACGMSVVCIRIGSVNEADRAEGSGAELSYLGASPEVRAERLKTTWMSHRDLARLIRAILERPVPYAIVYGIGDNPNRFYDLEPGRALFGFWPLDGAVPD